MIRWYMPTWHGDLRIEQVDERTSELILYKPTPTESAAAEKIVAVCASRGWCDAEIDLTKKKVRCLIRAPMVDVGPIASRILRPGEAVLTAVVFKDGHVETSSKNEGPTLEALTEKALTPYREPAALTEAEKPKAIATVKRPTPCCPDCKAGAIEPATEALLAFLTPDEHAQWAAERAIEIRGGLTGFRYLLAHRNSRLAEHNGRICHDLDNDFTLHFHDWSVPPEEEVLAAKLILEHREPWLRNEATCLARVGTMGSLMQHGCFKFKNPFGDFMDGTESAALAGSLGMMVSSAVLARKAGT